MIESKEVETFNPRYFRKRCITCDALGYKTGSDYKRGKRYCFTHNRYITAPETLVCPQWIPTD